MKYRELLERYKKGLASEEEKLYIEQDIEKYRAIEDYLSDIADKEFINLVEMPELEKGTEETARIKKSVNKRLRKVVFSSVAAVILLIFMIFFVISPFVDSLYYNPAKVSVGNNYHDIDFDMKAITELNMPEYAPSTVYVEKKGFGIYDLNYSYRNIFTDEVYKADSIIRRGEIYSADIGLFQDGNMFLDIKHPIREQKYIYEQKERVLEHIEQLNPSSYVSAGITFHNDLTMEELSGLEKMYPNIEFVWAGIRTDLPENTAMDLIGIHLRTGSMLVDDKVEEKYRAFNILEWLVNPVGSDNGSVSIEAQAYALHYKSLLEYVLDREKAVNAIERKSWKYEFYQSALNYAKEYGVKTYGVLVFAEAKDLVELVENEQIKLIELGNAMVSKRNIK